MGVLKGIMQRPRYLRLSNELFTCTTSLVVFVDLILVRNPVIPKKRDAPLTVGLPESVESRDLHLNSTTALPQNLSSMLYIHTQTTMNPSVEEINEGENAGIPAQGNKAENGQLSWPQVCSGPQWRNDDHVTYSSHRYALNTNSSFLHI